ncbi:ThuA domain-containing protein [Streptomyces sp. NPDC001002]
MSPQLLVFTRTTGFRHDSIPDAVKAVRELGDDHGFGVFATEDPTNLESGLGPYAAVLFLSTSGKVLTDLGRANLKEYVEGGGGFVGVHSAAGTEYEWPYYGDLLGARFADHPPYQPGRLHVEDPTHPATQHLPRVWNFTDEWYNFRTNPRGSVHVLARADEGSYEGGGMGADHPMVWCREEGAGRVFYTALGHAAEAYQDPAFRGHLLGGIRWASQVEVSREFG